MWRIPFLIYCVACWEYFLFEPLIALNLLMIGFIFVGRRRERQNDFERLKSTGLAKCPLMTQSGHANRYSITSSACPG